MVLSIAQKFKHELKWQYLEMKYPKAEGGTGVRSVIVEGGRGIN